MICQLLGRSGKYIRCFTEGSKYPFKVRSMANAADIAQDADIVKPERIQARRKIEVVRELNAKSTVSPEIVAED